MSYNTSRRKFLKISAAAGLAAQLPGTAFAADKLWPAGQEAPMVGIQVSPLNFFDEGMERTLDILQDAGVNALFCYSHTYHESYNKPEQVFAPHGAPVKGFANRKLPHRWVRAAPQFYGDSFLGHERSDPDREFHDRDIFKELLEPVRKRGMKLYARMLEAGANRKDLIPNYDKVLTKDIFGQPGRGPCWNHPDYRAWLVGTVRDLVSNYRLDGFQYGAERTGPLPYLLNRGLTPTCFCEFCMRRNRAAGIDTDRARLGYLELYQYIRKIESGPPPAGSITETIHGFFQRYPELLAWNYQWFQADNEIHREIYSAVKRIDPALEVGRHVDHQRSSWDIWYRSAVPYGDMADSADFVKPILYHDILGPRLKHWVVREMKKRVSGDLSEADILRQFYAQFGHDPDAMPSLEALDSTGLGAAYVARETRRCVTGLGGRARVYAGIGVDVPWHLPEGGMAAFPSPPEVLKEAVQAAFSAGADGILISREYEEIRLESLKAIGAALKELKRG